MALPAESYEDEAPVPVTQVIEIGGFDMFEDGFLADVEEEAERERAARLAEQADQE